MSLPAILLLLATPAAAEASEIVVVAERLDRVRVNVVRDGQNRWHCSLDGSSGVRSLDEGLCKAVTRCVRKGAATDAAVAACVTRNKASLLARFRREREARR